MSRRSLPRLPLQPIGFRKDGRPIFPILGAEDLPSEQGGTKPGDGEGSSSGGQSGGTPDAVDDEGVALGFPKNTPVEQMTAVQQAAYWRNESKKQQKRAEAAPKDYEQQKADAEKWRQQQEEQKTPSQKAIDEAEARGKIAAAADNALALVSVILTSRGKTEKEADDLLVYVNPASLLDSDGKVARQKVTALADKLVPSSSSSNNGGGFGQGNYQQSRLSGVEAGRAEAAKRFAAKK